MVLLAAFPIPTGRLKSPALEKPLAPMILCGCFLSHFFLSYAFLKTVVSLVSLLSLLTFMAYPTEN